MSWLFLTILSYLILAIVFLIDKYLLVNYIISPKVYSFYVGILGISTLVLIPFVNFSVPKFSQILLSFMAGSLFILALFWLYKGLILFDLSRIIPAIGGLIPIFSFGLIYLFSFGKETLSFLEIIAFLFLVLGIVLITLKKDSFITLKSFKISFLAAFLFSLSFVLTKYVYLSQSFWSGFIWIKIGGVLTGFCFFLLFQEVRKEISFKKVFAFKQRKSLKITSIFLFNQSLGAVSGILQNFAIFLAPLSYIALINALQGVQYLFLLILVIFLSLTRPIWTKKVGLKEEISKEILLQKITAILFIGAGLFLLIIY